MNPLASAFVLSSGTITENVVNGDYTNSKLVITVDPNAGGTVKVNGETYSEVAEFNAGDIIALQAIPASGKTFKSWSNGKTNASISVVATGLPMAITAFFENE